MSTASLAMGRRLLQHTGARVPVLCGPMYPGSNPELVAAVSESGGIGIVQPVSLTHLYGHDFREGLQYIKSLTSQPFGVNLSIIPNKEYEKKMDMWLRISLEEGVRFFLTSLGKPHKIAKIVHEHGGYIYHDVHTPELAAKALDGNVDGLNLLNDSMGGQTGKFTAAEVLEKVQGLGGDVPLVCAGGIGDASGVGAALDMGYAGAQLGTRFLASNECKISDNYKQGIVKAKAEDITWVNFVGNNSSVIRTPDVESGVFNVGPVTSFFMGHKLTRGLARTYLMTNAMKTYKNAAFSDDVQLWQAGKGVESITSIKSCADILEEHSTLPQVQALHAKL